MGLYELIMITGVFMYMYYNCYMLWKDAHNNRGYNEE